MLREVSIRSIMSTDVLTFTSDENVRDAMRALLARGFDAAPVIDDNGDVAGILSTADLIVQESQLQFPAVIEILGATIKMPRANERFERDLAKALGATVGEVMADHVVTCRPDDTVEDAATLMHDKSVSRLPVVDASGALVGIVARGDIVRAIVADLAEADAGGPGDGDLDEIITETIAEMGEAD